MEQFQHVVMENLTPVLTVTEASVAIAYIVERMTLQLAGGKSPETERYWIRRVPAK